MWDVLYSVHTHRLCGMCYIQYTHIDYVGCVIYSTHTSTMWDVHLEKWVSSLLVVMTKTFYWLREPIKLTLGWSQCRDTNQVSTSLKTTQPSMHVGR